MRWSHTCCDLLQFKARRLIFDNRFSGPTSNPHHNSSWCPLVYPLVAYLKCRCCCVYAPDRSKYCPALHKLLIDQTCFLPLLVVVVFSRLPHVGTDLLITVNVPYPDEETAANSAFGVHCFFSGDAPSPSEQQQDPSTSGQSDGLCVDVGVVALRTVLKSFAILDWSLFG